MNLLLELQSKTSVSSKPLCCSKVIPAANVEGRVKPPYVLLVLSKLKQRQALCSYTNLLWMRFPNTNYTCSNDFAS